MADSPAVLVAAVCSAIAGLGAAATAIVNYRQAGATVKTYLRREGSDLIVEASNTGRGAATIIRIGLAETAGLFMADKLHSGIWLHSGPTPDGNVVNYRIHPEDATSWKISALALQPFALSGKTVRAYVHLGSGKIRKSRRRTAIKIA